MSSNFFTVLTSFVILTLLSFCGYSEGKTLPSRIISLSPPLTEQIFLLGAQDRLVACTTYCLRPPEARSKEKIGSILDVNVEKIVSLTPDIVLATGLTKPGIVDKLRELGVKVELFQSPKKLDDIYSQFMMLSELLGEKDKAAKIVSESKSKLEALKNVLGDDIDEKPRVVFQIGSNPLFFAGGDYFIGEFVSCAGGINILADKKSGIYSREFIVAENPDVILIAEMGLSGDGEMAEWSRFKTMNAVKNKRIFSVDQTSACSPSPAGIPELVCRLGTFFHPSHRDKLEKCLFQSAP